MSNAFFPEVTPEYAADYLDEASEVVTEIDALRAELAEAKALLALRDEEVDGVSKTAEESIKDLTKLALSEIAKRDAEISKHRRVDFSVSFLSSFMNGITSTIGAGVGLGGRQQMYRRAVRK